MARMKKFGKSTKTIEGCVGQISRKFDATNFSIITISEDEFKVIFHTKAYLGESCIAPWEIHKAPNQTCSRPFTIMRPE